MRQWCDKRLEWLWAQFLIMAQAISVCSRTAPSCGLRVCVSERTMRMCLRVYSAYVSVGGVRAYICRRTPRVHLWADSACMSVSGLRVFTFERTLRACLRDLLHLLHDWISPRLRHHLASPGLRASELARHLLCFCFCLNISSPPIRVPALARMLVRQPLGFLSWLGCWFTTP